MSLIRGRLLYPEEGILRSVYAKDGCLNGMIDSKASIIILKYACEAKILYIYQVTLKRI